MQITHKIIRFKIGKKMKDETKDLQLMEKWACLIIPCQPKKVMK